MLYLFALVFVSFVQDMSPMEYICNRKDPCGCSSQPVKTGRIIGGEPALHDSWSWTISIQNGSNHFCGGSILNERYIITAAHCLIDKMNRLSNITVCAGTNRLSGTCHQRHEIQTIINHPSYNRKTFENDIALIQVKVPFDFTDKSIARICLPNTTHSDQYPETGTDVIAVGWGRNESGQQSDTLQQVTIQVVNESTDTCKDVLSNHLVQLCAGAPAKDICFGDSGGPLMVFTDSKHWELVGITSYGKGNDCATEHPSVYTRITAFLTWIQQIVNNTSSQMSAMKYICNHKDPCGCSSQPVKTGRIIGGEPALHDSWSWTISIQVGNNHHCGGSILNERYIITAAHCLIDKMNRLSNITVCAGTNRLSGTCHQRHEIQTIINHPSYNRKTFENDIALIQVKVPFDFTDKSIARICLPNTTHSDQYPETGTDVIAVGWGRNEAGQQPDTLQQVTIQVVDELTDTCDDVLNNSLVQLCAGAPGKDTCTSDSGGPLMVFTDSKQWELVGITSYGTACSTKHPGVYTRITAFLTWIQQIVNNTSPQPSSHRCSCECPRGSNPSTAYTSVYTAFACVDACKVVLTNPCDSSNTYACLGTNCAYSTNTGYSLTGNSPNIEVFTWSNGDRYEGEFKDGKMHGKGTLNFANGQKYIGDWIEGKRTGRGIFTWPNGDRYEGQFKDDKRRGTGTFTSADGEKYIGDWIEDKRTGRSVFTWPNGDRYQGEFKDGKMHGKGTLNFANGQKYIGDWIEGKRTGRGIFTWPNGNRYEGEFKNDARTGHGVFNSSNGDRYEGQFKDDKMHGTGTMTFINGDKYIGNWIENKRTGRGVFTWPKGNRYEGDFHNNVRTGRGIFNSSNGDRYEGQFKDDKMHGTGTMTFINGDKYIGNWIENKRTGRGVFTWPKGNRYEGDFHNNVRTGRGIFNSSNGDRYEGQFKDDKMHGTGTMTFINGDKYIGNWIENKRTGRGVFTWPKGNRYEGDFHNNVRTGRGIFNSSNGDRYEGQFKDDKMHGTGTMTFINGDKYIGNWIEGKRTGRGIFTWPNGDRYQGEFKDGKMHGKGTLNFANGQKYIGDWIEGKRTGRGIFTWPNGNRYEGEFKNDARTGHGVFNSSNGDRYEGQFKDDKMHGTGTMTFINGDKYIGNWIENKRTGRGVFTWPNGNRYEGEFKNDARTGHGVFNSSNGDRYEGQFKDDKMHGTGTMTFINGDKYIGNWIENKRTGRGVFTWPKGNRYEGDFHNNVRTGRGIFSWSNGNRYGGEFKDDKIHGTGKMIYANGKVTYGRWSNDVFVS